MMTTRSQRAGIWIIAVVMAVGSLGVFFVAILASQNQTRDAATTQTAIAEYQAAVQKQADELSQKYYPVLSQYADRVGEFNASEVTALESNDLKEGDGETIGATTTYAAYYIGWNPSAKIFDQSIDGTKLKAPLPVQSNGGVITGWSKGVEGMKLGGVRELTIPAAQAYGNQSPSADIPANTPLKFIILAIPKPADVPIPNSLRQQ